MSSPVPCVPECASTPLPVQVPGAPGTPGVSAFTNLNQVGGLLLPAANTTTTVTVLNSSWMTYGLVVLMSDGTNHATFVVASNPAAPYTSVSLTFQPQDGDASAGTTILNNAMIMPSGINGASAQTTINAVGGLTIPNAPPATQLVTATVLNSKWMVAGQIVIVGDGTNQAVFSVNQNPSAPYTTVQLKLFSYYPGNSTYGTAIANGALVTPMGAAGTSAVNTTTAAITIPAAGSTVTISVQSTAMFQAGQYLFISDGTNYGTFQVASAGILTATTMKLTWLGLDSDSVVQGGTINSGALVAASAVPYGAGALASLTTPVSTSGTTKTTLMSYSVPANTLKNTGDSLEFEMVFVYSGGTNNKTVSVIFGAAPVTILTLPAADDTPPVTVSVRGRIVLTGATAQFCYAFAEDSSYSSIQNIAGSASGTENPATALTLAANGTCVAAGDLITQRYLHVNYKPA
jgi:hypothetical protein